MDDFESFFWLILFIGIVIRYAVTTSRFSNLRHRVEDQARDIAGLKQQLAQLREQGVQPASTPAEQPATATAILPPVVEHEPVTVTPPAPPEQPVRPAAEPAREKIKAKAIEQQFGNRAFVWVGGVALALAGFYLVKYSIDTGLLTEKVRVVLGVLFGLVLLTGSYFIRANPGIANSTRIGQALAGAGIADLYGSLFAATTLYHLLPPWLGFGAMAATTALALVLSLRHGIPIALLGLIGGYLTPALIEGEPNAPLLFGYLYLVYAGLSGVARGKNWWWLSIPGTFVAFAWVAVWILGGHAAQDATALSTFLLAIGITGVIAAPRRAETESVNLESPRTWARFIGPVGTIVLAGVVAYITDFGMFEWGMFALFALASVGLAVFDGRTYIAVPWIAMAVNLAMLAGWNAEPSQFALVLTGFALIFAVSGQLFMPRSYYPLLWAGLSAAATTAYFLLAYGVLNPWLEKTLAGNVWFSASATWTAIAFAAAALMTAAAARPFVLSREIAVRHRVQAVFAVAAVALISLGLAILLHEEYLSFAVAVEVLAIAWLRTRLDVPALRYLAFVLTTQFVLLLVPDGLQLSFESVGISAALSQSGLISTALFRFGLPAILFAGASYLTRDPTDKEYAIGLELGAAALLVVTIYKLIEAVFLGHATSDTLAIGSIFTIIVMALSGAVLRIYRRTPRDEIFWAGVALGTLGALRIVVLSLLAFNPLLSHQGVGNLPLLNGLLPIYAIPAMLLYVIGSELAHGKYPQAAPFVQGSAFLLGFIWLSLVVRQFFNGAYLDSGTISNAEVYAYSAAWLVVGIALLFAAALRKDMTMRIASLAVMLLTVGKVFLYDASQLTGLWRVVSFLGLGLSLLGLSWFYSRFIFTSEKAEPAT